MKNQRSSLRPALSLICLVLAFGGARVTAQTRGIASISGTVSLDGKPAPGIKVLANYADLDVGEKDAPPIIAITDDSGRYQFSQLEAGKYVITASAPAFVDARPHGDGFNRTTISIAASEAADKVDFQLKRGGVITGRVTDSEGRPAIAEPISLLFIDASGKITPLRKYLSTDDEGSYRAYGLMPGRYIVASGADPNRDAPTLGAYERTFHPATTDQNEAKIIDVVAEKEVSNVNITTRRRKKTFQASGKVYDVDGGAPVVVPAILLAFISNPDAISEMRSVKIDQNGRFLAEGLRPGKYAANIQGLSSLNYYQDPVSFEVTDADTDDIEIALHKGSIISGTVSVQGGSATQVPIHLSVTSVKPQLPIWFLSFANATVNGSGNFQIGGVRPGILKLNVFPESDALKLVSLDREGIPLGENISIGEKENLSGVRAVLAIGNCTINGELDFGGGEVPENLTFYISVKRSTGDVSSLNPDSRGKFQVENLLPGTYEITVSSGKLRPDLDRPNFLIAPVSKSVQVENGSPANVTIKVDLKNREVVK